MVDTGLVQDGYWYSFAVFVHDCWLIDLDIDDRPPLIQSLVLFSLLLLKIRRYQINFRGIVAISISLSAFAVNHMSEWRVEVFYLNYALMMVVPAKLRKYPNFSNINN